MNGRNSLIRYLALFFIAPLLLTLLSGGVFAACAEEKPLTGRYISVLGDSISTYTGWSDSQPITDESCTYRYGEAYYGPVGGDFHNTDLTVEDTWWHQAAVELGAEILVSNAGNSTGLLHASYPANADWQQYLQEMLAYKSRPYYLGTQERKPDVIALYIGSNDVARVKPENFGTVENVDFDLLISQSETGEYVYATPQTVAEAYCILLHKIAVTYPDAEVYCFTVVPNSGGTVNNFNKRLAPALPFNEMIRGVAAHFGAFVVDLFEEFALDPDGDGVATAEELEIFQSYFNNDPHPNAAGFDVITRCFVEAVRENTAYKAPAAPPPPQVLPEEEVPPVEIPPAEIPETGDGTPVLALASICIVTLIAFTFIYLQKKEVNPKTVNNEEKIN